MGKKDDNIDETNYRKYAKEAIAKYGERNMLIDQMFWSHIVGLYEKDIAELEADAKLCYGHEIKKEMKKR